jgi:glycogen synthase kinase 3 beta
MPHDNSWMNSLKARVADLDPNRVISEHVLDGKSESEVDIQYQCVKVVGNGSFGVVFQVRIIEPPQNPNYRDAAIKRVLQDKRFKVASHLPSPSNAQNRELQIMKLISHPNVVDLRYYYFCPGERVTSHSLLPIR